MNLSDRLFWGVGDDEDIDDNIASAVGLIMASEVFTNEFGNDFIACTCMTGNSFTHFVKHSYHTTFECTVIYAS